MTTLLTDLLAAGLIDTVNSDENFARIERAAETVAQEFRRKPLQLIRGILAGLDPDTPANDPLMAFAEKALVAEWKTMRNHHADSPINLYRSVLLEACNLVTDERNYPSILWMTAADAFLFVRQNREQAVLLQAFKAWASAIEAAILISPFSSEKKPLSAVHELPKTSGLILSEPRQVDRQNLLNRVAAASGQNYNNNPVDNPNPYWTNTQQHWSWAFSDRMHSLLADELDDLAADMVEIQNKLGEEMETFLADLTNAIKNKLASQVQTVQETLWAEQTRLNSLWWSEALYSPSLRCGYREIPPELAATIMAFDLLAEVSKPTPASVAHLLAETVNRLPGAGFDRKQGFRDWLLEICKTRDQFPQAVLKDLIPPPDEGRLSLRDAVVLALGKNPDVDAALRRTGISDDAELSLPVFSRALFRQEQAVRLAGGRA